MAQINVRLPTETWRRFKATAALRGDTITEAVGKMVDVYLAEDQSGQARELAETIAQAGLAGAEQAAEA